jgi:hypothetical protein
MDNIRSLNTAALDDNTDNEMLISKEQYSSNPFYVPYSGSALKYKPNKEIRNKYNRVLVFCLKDTVFMNAETIYKIKRFYSYYSDILELQKYSDLISIIEGPYEIINNVNHRNILVEISANDISKFGIISFKPELALCLLNIKQSDLKNYFRCYQNTDHFEEYIKLCLMVDYYQSKLQSKQYIRDRLIQIMTNCVEFSYWTDERNCEVNTNNSFISRRFVPRTTSKDLENLPTDIQGFIAGLMSIKPVKEANYLDDSEDIKKENEMMQMLVDLENTPKNRFDLMKQYNESNKNDRLHYFINDPTSCSNISKEQITELFTHPLLDEKEKYYLMCYLLISKKYCHLIVNNKNLLILLKPMFAKYYQVIRYLFGYTWLTLYLDETIRKTRTEITDRYVFDLETVNELPTYTTLNTSLHLNPYITSTLSQENINHSENVFGPPMLVGQPLGLCNINEFRRRINLFSTGNSQKFILEGLSFDNMILTGSCMTACLPKFNPLMALYTTSVSDLGINNANPDTIVSGTGSGLGLGPWTDAELLAFYKEYYGSSDIDIACNHRDLFDFIDHVFRIYETVKKNLNTEDVKLIPNKTLAIHVNENILKEEIIKGKIPFTLEYIINNKDSYEIKNFFYDKYIDLKRRQNISDTTKIKSHRNVAYDEHLKYVTFDNTSLVISMYKIEPIPRGDFSIHDTLYMYQDDVVNNDIDYDENAEIYIRFKESMKFKVESALLPHNIEIFRINFNDFFSTVARFHLPCVRSYYNGKTCYMLPSAITSYMTFVNVDYKYFVGNKDPVDIINKYRIRGFGTLLNKFELKSMLEYCCKFSKWEKIMDINVNNKQSLKSLLGTPSITHPMFRPNRKVINDNDMGMTECHDPFLLDEQYKHTDGYSFVLSLIDVISDQNERLQPNNDPLLFNLRHILPNGRVNPIKKWIIDYNYDFFIKLNANTNSI